MKISSLTLIIALFFTTLVWNQARSADEHLQFIVNDANPVKELSVKQVADFYYKKNRYWDDGSRVQFFDHRSSSTQKALFLKEILKKTYRDVDLFWISEKNQSGQGAPLEAPTDEMVISSVASLPGAIGYITDESADLTGVKKIPVKDLE